MPRLGRIAGYIFFWTAIGLFFAVQSVLTYTSNGQPARWDAPLVWQLGYWYTWAILAPLIYRVADRLPLEDGRWRRSLPMLLLFTALLAPLHVAVSTVVRAKVMLWTGILTDEAAAGRIEALPARLLAGSLDAAFTLWMIFGVIYAFLYYRRLREEEVAMSELKAELAAARLSNLRAQIQPHFLFNTLNSISALVSDDAVAAERMIARLSQLLRLALDAGHSAFVTVRDEVRFAELYLEIESVRFEDRLNVEVDIASDVLDARIPALILQPIVENAIKHGIAPHESDGYVGIRAARTDTGLVIEVVDSGDGFDREKMGGGDQGIGLSNTLSRLDHLFGRDWSLSTDRSNGQFRVMLTLPDETHRAD